jgi:hypothetical protein
MIPWMDYILYKRHEKYICRKIDAVHLSAYCVALCSFRRLLDRCLRLWSAIRGLSCRETSILKYISWSSKIDLLDNIIYVRYYHDVEAVYAASSSVPFLCIRYDSSSRCNHHRRPLEQEGLKVETNEAYL